MKGCLRGLIWFIVIGLICTVIVTWIATQQPTPPKPFNPGGVGQQTTTVR